MQAGARRGHLSVLERIQRALDGALAPWVVGAITAALVWWMWGGLAMPGTYHDERAYLVQARLLATFSWTAPAPPIPLFWEMPHLFVEPRIFARYPPGHSLALVPGIWFGLPGLVPMLLAGVFAGIVYSLARTISGPFVALGTWGLWTVAPTTLDWHSSYFSETTSALCWLAALTLLHRWAREPRPWHLPTLVAAMACLGITRPVTGLALLGPVTVVVLLVSWRRRSMQGWLPSAAIGLAICAIVPYWSYATMGTVRSLPYAEYSHWYFPFDMPGFVRDTSPPLRELPPDFVALANATRRQYEGHVPSTMPGNFVARSWDIARTSLGPVATPLVAFVPLGMLAAGVAVSVVAVSSFALAVTAYLVMPHSIGWTIYYLELFPLIPFFAVAGLAWLARYVKEPRAAAAVVALLVLFTVRKLPEQRRHEEVRGARQRLTEALIADLENPRAVIFVRRVGAMSPHFTLWDVRGVPERTPTWIVRDLGDAQNAELIARAGDRVPYLLDEARMELHRLAPPPAQAATPASTHQAIP